MKTRETPTIEDMPAGASLTQQGPRVWNLEWETSAGSAQNSPYTLTLTANDGHRDSEDVFVAITVEAVIPPPPPVPEEPRGLRIAP
jgi:hypothetical protein